MKAAGGISCRIARKLMEKDELHVDIVAGGYVEGRLPVRRVCLLTGSWQSAVMSKDACSAELLNDS